ncbi:MAG: rhodanese-like domain-containing protein [Alphaproteobacteria bacterium]|nr:rhodanese-like domain-containing protein [Alphaproteobacteria bacterium]
MIIDQIPSISVADLAAAMAKDDIFLLDVREQTEWDKARIEKARHIPMGQVSEHLEELPQDKQIVVICHHGGRSAHVAYALNQCGFRALTVDGGIHQFALQIDNTIPLY